MIFIYNLYYSGIVLFIQIVIVKLFPLIHILPLFY